MYDIVADIAHDFMWIGRTLAGPMQAHSMDDSRAFTRSEQILLDYQRLQRMNARDLKDLIQRVLHHNEFNAAKVDQNMQERLMRAVEDRQINSSRWISLICGRKAMASKMSDSLNTVEGVLRELLAHEGLKGCQFYAFKEYKLASGSRESAQLGKQGHPTVPNHAGNRPHHADQEGHGCLLPHLEANHEAA